MYKNTSKKRVTLIFIFWLKFLIRKNKNVVFSYITIIKKLRTGSTELYQIVVYTIFFKYNAF